MTGKDPDCFSFLQPTRVRFRAHLWLGLLPLLTIVAIVGCGSKEEPPSPLGDVQFSILAVGDTGRHWVTGQGFSKQRIVARGIESEDRRLPAEAFLLLGDNFYEYGLRADEMVERLKENIVGPYCRFVELAGSASGEVADACRLAPQARHPIPIYAVLGNHDRSSPESPTLEKEAIPWFVSNWHMANGVAEAFEIGHGVSLILFDSEVLARGKGIDELSHAIGQAQGPWRILVAHRPLKRKAPDQGHYGFENQRYVGSVERAIREAGVPIQISLSGHEHNLQILEPGAPLPALTIVAGSGARVRKIKEEMPERRFGLEKLGFVRLDLVGSGDGKEERLVVSVFATDRFLSLVSALPQLVARYSVSVTGKVRCNQIHRSNELIETKILTGGTGASAILAPARS